MVWSTLTEIISASSKNKIIIQRLLRKKGRAKFGFGESEKRTVIG